MSGRLKAFLCIVAGAVLSVSSSASTTLRSGRSIVATSHCWSGVDLTEKGNDFVEIHSAGYSIVVAPKQLIVDGRTFAVIDDKVKSVDVDITKSKIAFKADGDPVGSLVR